MCGIAGIIINQQLSFNQIKQILTRMNQIQKHRGPDGEGIWISPDRKCGLAHVRLSIIDQSLGMQPMISEKKNVITFNGEIYNYLELRAQLGNENFKTNSDTEVILKAYEKWGVECLEHLRGMFAFAIWDNQKQILFAARDRFGIKPFYYAITEYGFVFSSEAKTLLPFLKEIQTDTESLKDYITFQFVLDDKTLFKNIRQLNSSHYLIHYEKKYKIQKYWEVQFKLDWEHTKSFFEKEVYQLLNDSIKLHLRSDVPVGAYLSGGLDSSIVSSMSRKFQPESEFNVFTGKFTDYPGFDESIYAKSLADYSGLNYHEINISSDDFINNIRKVIYHLDYPVAGPGSFPQYMVSNLASKHLKVVLGGQGGDEIFGGYVRYLISYFEQCIKGAIEGTTNSGNFIVTYESIIPNLSVLNNYKSLLKEFWSDGLFDSRDQRYFKLVNRANDMNDIVNWEVLEPYSAFESFKKIFWGGNVEPKSYFDSMTHFDFKTLLPALLQVEDRMSMAHGLESRVPFLDHPLVELVATIPSNIKFENGNLKHLLKHLFKNKLPEMIINRKDKMGFPVPLTEWYKKEISEFLKDIFHSKKASERFYLRPGFDLKKFILSEPQFSRKIWGLLSLELWQQEFHDKPKPFSFDQ
ncbi:MAG: hypothetical protein ACD_79C00252G0010 [uncultured bacterium]|nr:MAG: hypothetical protein ACD_79C00252G0010 [uncultured bacterium]